MCRDVALVLLAVLVGKANRPQKQPTAHVDGRVERGGYSFAGQLWRQFWIYQVELLVLLKLEQTRFKRHGRIRVDTKPPLPMRLSHRDRGDNGPYIQSLTEPLGLSDISTCETKLAA